MSLLFFLNSEFLWLSLCRFTSEDIAAEILYGPNMTYISLARPFVKVDDE